ncbi:phosphatase PAP2 family protein [Oceanotoga sp. DSM 15011]|uniref:phosphatase PAP2 family protein n=1 Tax=Oceanotoga sp. DSM 15011 TaxID=2984951 RepID=UPI0021F4AAD1|nr:phosphatase PAP2 family protein [Oceanotoga sp. DSM 15011]UYP00206.1 phosphatase PAP2 family protein [Oceanotoga sp. DSM 15011]
MELEILKSIQSISNNFFDVFFEIITIFGEELFIIPVLAVIYWGIDKRFGEYIGFSIFSSLLVNNFLKDIFKFNRPIGEENIRSLRVETATGYSFPSGHSQGAGTFYSSLSFYIRKKIIYLFSFIMIILIGFSRLYLGVHYPKDVLVGIILGVFISYITYFFYYRVLSRNKMYIILLMIFAPLLLFVESADFYKIYGSYFGFVLGIILEKKYINFNTDIKFIKKFLRIFLGIGLIFILKISLKIFFVDHVIFDMIRYFFIVFFGIGIYPMIFKKLSF